MTNYIELSDKEQAIEAVRSHQMAVADDSLRRTQVAQEWMELLDLSDG